MTAHDKKELLNALIRLIADEDTLTKWERRDILETTCQRLGGWSAENYLKNKKNNRKLKIKRGNSAENDEYTGVCGEITMDTDCNTIRVHDGATPGGTTMARADSVTDMTGTDYVIACQTPTAENNYTWFRKYKSGWVEQGGYSTLSVSGAPAVITLPIEMSNEYYTVTTSSRQKTFTLAQDTVNRNTVMNWSATITGQTTTQFGARSAAGESNYSGFNWYVCGMSA